MMVGAVSVPRIISHSFQPPSPSWGSHLEHYLALSPPKNRNSTSIRTMASPKEYTNGPTVVMVVLILCFTLLPLRPVGLQQRRVGLGSRPPLCVNKCLSCRPCMATLVVSPRQRKSTSAASRDEEGDTYYLLSWKCACGNKLFWP